MNFSCRSWSVLGLLVLLGLGTGPARADIDITPTTSAPALAAAVTGSGLGGITVTGSMLSGHSTPDGVSSGTYVLTSPPDTYGLFVPGIVLSSGNVSAYETGPNTDDDTTTTYGIPATAAQEALLDPITGGAFDHFDVTQLDITFDASAATSAVFFNVVFGSEEFDTFVGTSFIDGFGLYLNGVNIAFVMGDPVNINHPGMMFLAGTELNGILVSAGNPIITYSGPVTPGSVGNVLTFIVADTSDPTLDTTVYISALGGAPPPTGGEAVPEPGSLALAATGLLGLIGYRWRRRVLAA